MNAQNKHKAMTPVAPDSAEVLQIFEMLPKSLNGIIFDCDGVLIDSREANIHYYNQLLQFMGYPPMKHEDEDFIHMASVGQALDYLLHPDDLPRLEEAARHVPYKELVLPKLVLEPGILDLLTSMREQGFCLAVHTNRGRGMWDVLDKFGLRDVFDPVMTADVVQAKPHPEGVLKVLQTWQTPAETVLFLGDSRADAEAAHAGGVHFAAYKNPLLPVANHITSFTALQKAVNQKYCLQNR